MREIDLCFVTDRCADCPATQLGMEWGEATVEVAQKALLTVNNDPLKIAGLAGLRIPGTKKLVEDSCSPSLGTAERLFIVDGAAMIVWWSALGKCKPNKERINRGELHG